MMTDYFKPTHPPKHVKLCLDDTIVASNEQSIAIDHIRKGYSLKIIASAGAAKTTTALLLAKGCPQKYFLVLTYNTELACEMRERCKQCGLTNIDCQTIHAQIAQSSHRKCFTDRMLIEQLRRWQNGGTLKRLTVDVLILDEAQDLRPTFYEAITYMMPATRCQIIGMGDPKQLLYDYHKDDAATDMYLRHMQKYFGDYVRTDLWRECCLSISFRLTPKRTGFVNQIWNTSIVPGNTKDPDTPVEYWHMGAYDPAFRERLVQIFDAHKPDDILIISHQNLKSKTGKERPLSCHINKLIDIKNEQGLQKYKFAIKDHDAEGKASTENKIRVFTMCASKGLTVPVAIVFGFDMYRGRQAPINQVCVALSRASERLIVVHTKDNRGQPNSYYPGLSSSILRDMIADGTVVAPDGVPEDITYTPEPPKPEALPVTAITHISAMTQMRLIEYCTVTTLQEPQPPMPLETVRTFRTGVSPTQEEFSAIYGTAIPFALKWKRIRRIPEVEHILNRILIVQREIYNEARLYDTLAMRGVHLTPLEMQTIHARFEEFHSDAPFAWMPGSRVIDMLKMEQGCGNLPSLEHLGIYDEMRYERAFPQQFLDIIREKYAKPNKEPPDFMILANTICAYDSTHELMTQMGSNYDWVNDQVFLRALEIFEEHVPAECTFEVQRHHTFDPPVESQDRCYQAIIGVLDALHEDSTVFELKFTSSITDEHILQTMLYVSMQICEKHQDTGKGILLNARTEECLRIDVTRERAFEVLRMAAEARL